MNGHPALRLTPSNSPFFKSSAPKSPVKVTRTEEPGLRLSKVIGTTTTSANGFDCLPSLRTFAYTAGAAAVVASVNADLKITQRFFKARPSSAAVGKDSNGQWYGSPTPNDPRNRPLGSVREQTIGASPLSSSRDWSDSPTGRTSTAKDRVKAATSVALSPDGKWLAVGETGYKPRILIFALADNASDVPVTVLSEHTFGINALRFSPDSRYLASLGAINDGYLYVWSIDGRNGSASLHASNKCTTLINCMTWMGSSIVTVGLRFVKVWRPDADASLEPRRQESTLSPLTPRHRSENRSSEFNNSILSPRHKVLVGKNSLLGDVLECNFVSALAISDTEAIICAETGEICYLNDGGQAQQISLVALTEFEIHAARLEHPDQFLVLGADGQSCVFAVSQLKEPAKTHITNGRRRSGLQVKIPRSEVFAVATAGFDDTSVRLDSNGNIWMTSGGDTEGGRVESIAGHTDAILGVLPVDCPALPDAAFLTFSGNGTIVLWDKQAELIQGLTLPVASLQDAYGPVNSTTALALCSDGSALAVGDKYGTLSLHTITNASNIKQLRAHSTEITDICAFKAHASTQLVATASRDRTVQLFACIDNDLELLQTLDEHAAAVTGLLATAAGHRLLSISADRSVVVREACLRDPDDPRSVAFVMLRVINLKTAPTSMCFGADDDTLLVATTDRAISKYSIRTGHAGFSFKCSDSEGGEAVAMAKILHSASLNGGSVIMGVSSSDKSVRLYSEFGSLIARDWGHTEGVTGAALLVNNVQAGDGPSATTQIVTVAADSTIFLWDTTPAASSAQQPPDTLGADAVAPLKAAHLAAPLRKVLSYSELSRFRRESSQEEADPGSPTAMQTPTQPSSPHRTIRKKTSRMSVAQAPRLEPAFRSNFAEPSSSKKTRRQSLRQRSPSPPSPRTAAKREHLRRPSLGMSLRSKSSENVLNTISAPPMSNGFGSLTSSTESICRTLRTYRKKLANSSANDNIAPETLRELEKELKLTARVLSEKSHGKTLDEAMMARLLDQASEKIVGMLDERIKERVESEVRRSSDGSPLSSSQRQSLAMDASDEPGDALAGALEKVALEK